LANLENCEIKDFITVDILSDTLLFAISIIDIANSEVLYVNQAMKKIMADINAKYCWEAIYGQDSRCMWCKKEDLLAQSEKLEASLCKVTSENFATYELFNEVANSWYLVQEKVVTLENKRRVIISFHLDISMQKEAQSQLINTHVQLRQQTQALEEAQEKLKEQASRDPMTNLYNRRYFQDISEELINIAKRESLALSIIMLDIDRFKTINDTHGHAVGDDVIKLLAALLLEYTRDSDVVARLGGEEFAILLPHTDRTGAFNIASKIREVVEKQIVKTDTDKNIQFTISSGVDGVNLEKDNKIDTALNNADKALYIAKQSGRNTVVTH